MTNVEQLLILNMIEDLGSVRIRNLLEHFGSLDKIFQAGAKDIERVKKIGPVIAPNVVQSIKDINIKEELKLIKKHKLKVISFLDDDYPKNLKNIYDPPVVLYIKGEILPEDDLGVAIVGSRLASFYGLQQAERLGFELALRGITVTSGLARGIDSSAHKGALKAKGRTLAVLGSGILNIYPEEHAVLADEISKSGAVISEFPMKTIPHRGHFPKRNRIISGLSLGVVVVEAARRSGALITADSAMDQGRDVFALPGKVDSVTSVGTNKLIKQGAKLVASVEDIIEELNLPGKVEAKKILPKLDKTQTLVYNLLSSEPNHIDGLQRLTNMNITELSRILLDMEIKKFIRQLPGKNFVKNL